MKFILHFRYFLLQNTVFIKKWKQQDNCNVVKNTERILNNPIYRIIWYNIKPYFNKSIGKHVFIMHCVDATAGGREVPEGIQHIVWLYFIICLDLISFLLSLDLILVIMLLMRGYFLKLIVFIKTWVNICIH